MDSIREETQKILQKVDLKNRPYFLMKRKGLLRRICLFSGATNEPGISSRPSKIGGAYGFQQDLLRVCKKSDFWSHPESSNVRILFLEQFIGPSWLTGESPSLTFSEFYHSKSWKVYCSQFFYCWFPDWVGFALLNNHNVAPSYGPFTLQLQSGPHFGMFCFWIQGFQSRFYFLVLKVGSTVCAKFE